MSALVFKRGLSRFLTKVDRNADVIARNMACIMAENIIVGGLHSPGTPVDTGFARGSWYPAINGQPTSDMASTTDAVSRAQNDLSKGHAGDTFELWTNTAYMPALEYGHSKQAPRGMVRTTLSSVGSIYEEAARQLG